MIDHHMNAQASTFNLGKVRAVTLRDQLVNQLREAILRGSLRPGQRLVERSLAESTGTSQSSVREALQLLEVEGLVTKTTNTATFVTELPADRLREHINVRLQLEPYALVLASSRLSENDVELLEALVASLREHALHQDLYRCSREDFDFHRRLWMKSGNETLTKMLVQIGTVYFAYTSLLPGLSDEELDKRFGSHVKVAERWRAGLEDRYEKHRQLLDAVLSREPERIRQEARRHVLDGWRWILEDGGESVNQD
jgi:DNA-binding GntR family transcriptional regulator